MKRLLLLLFVWTQLISNAQYDNYAIKFDGVDDKIGIYMDKIDQWTVEAWVKRGTSAWTSYESIVGNDAFEPVGRVWEEYPLILNNGRPGVYGANLYASSALSSGWHHIASTCDGTTTRLYVDGIKVGSKTYAKPTSPNFIGSSNRKNFFVGHIDEVRIWNEAISASEISDWMNKSIKPNHPSFDNLIAYYPFDDQNADATDMVGHNQGDLKNNDYYEPTANDPSYELANNSNFNTVFGDMTYINAEVLQNNWLVYDNETEIEIAKLKICTIGDQAPLSLDAITLDLSTTTDLSDIKSVKVYDLGSDPANPNKTLLFGGGVSPSQNIIFNRITPHQLGSGVNYLEIAFELNNSPTIDNELDLEVSSFELSGVVYTPGKSKANGSRKITSSQNNSDIVRAMAFNIWHGGRETGFDVGVQRTIDIIKASKADIIFMVESYGAQQTIANALGYNLYTKGSGDNLSIISRYPIVETYNSSYSSFKAIGAKVKLDNNREVIVWDVWLAYSSPDYSSDYRRPDPTPSIWVNGDRGTTVPDINGILSRDVKPNAPNPNIPIIIAGDFNSASHLDWTENTKSLHGGVGAVDWPVHKIMIDDEGYTDSYRTVHPDPLTHQGSTWAAIYNWSNNLRIDYIYHKGPNVRTLASEVISTHPVAGVMWPGDHDAVLTTYDFSSDGKPQANFSANNTVIKQGEKVDFSDLSLNLPTSWSWTFEGGTPSSSTNQNPSVTYSKTGTYKVTLTVSNNNGSDTKTIEKYITVKDGSICDAETYQSGTAYSGGDEVFYNGKQWRAKWWTRGDTPGNASVWEDLGACVITSQNDLAVNTLEIFPNPTNSNLTITAEKAIQLIEIFDSNGRLVLSTSELKKSTTIDCSSFSNGVYFINAKVQGNRFWSKFVKK